MNHVLKDVAGTDRAANLATYADPSLPVDPALVDGDRRVREEPPLADRQVALLVDQPPLVEVPEHDPRRLLGQVCARATK